MRSLRAWVVLLLSLSATARTLPAQWEWAASVTNEGNCAHARSDSLFNPDKLLFEPQRGSNYLLGSGRLSLKLSEGRVRLQVAGTQMLSRDDGTHARFLLREGYAVVTANDNWDFSVGKKLVKWGTGVAYNPSGFADPPKNPRDPNDRLGLNQGTELVQANYVRGQSSIDVVYFAPRLYFTSLPIRSRDRLAVRYNRLLGGMDASVMALLASNAPHRLGGNFSYVWGSSTELHGELVLMRPSVPQAKMRFLEQLGLAPPISDPLSDWPGDASRRLVAQSVLGGNYTFRSGWTLTGEWHHDGDGFGARENRLTYDRLEAASLLVPDALHTGDTDAVAALEQLAFAAQQLPGLRQNRDSVFGMASVTWGHERYSLQAIAFAGVQDRSVVLIPGFNAQLHRNWQVYFRPSFFLGKRKSEHGSQIYGSVFTAGVRYNL